VAQTYNHLTWLVSAISEQETPSNLPAGQGDCQSTGQTGGLDQSTGGPVGLDGVNQPAEGNSINRPDPMQLHYRNSTILKKAASVVASGVATAMGTLPAAAHPPDQPAFFESANREISAKELSEKLFDAAGDALNRTTPTLEVMSMPRAWLNAGCDLEHDILPTIRAIASRKRAQSISTWKFFERAIADAKAARLAPMPDGQPPPASSRESNWHEKQEAALKYLFR
jgi:hypothetical protein